VEDSSAEYQVESSDSIGYSYEADAKDSKDPTE